MGTASSPNDAGKDIICGVRIPPRMKGCHDAGFCLRSTRDFEAIRSLSLRSGLEDGKFEDIAVAFGCYSGDRLIGCAAMKRVGGTYSIEWLAVDESHRRSGLGRMMVEKVASEARRQGATHLWALARAPDFFLRIGFTKSAPEDSPGPSLAGCLKCDQYGVTCSPEIVVMEL